LYPLFHMGRHRLTWVDAKWTKVEPWTRSDLHHLWTVSNENLNSMKRNEQTQTILFRFLEAHFCA
jgi:hypothetical protein